MSLMIGHNLKLNIMRKLFLAIAVVGLASCSKDRVEQTSYQSMDEFYDMYEPEEQTFIVDTGGTGPIVAEELTELFVDSSIFMHQNGDDVSYPFELRYIEIYQKGDMVLGRAPSVSNGSILNSSGEGRIRAYKDGEELLLKPNKNYLVKFYDYFGANGTETEYYGTNSEKVTNWTGNGESVPVDTNYLAMLGDEMGWISGAKPLSTFPLLKTITLNLPGSNPENVGKFVIVNDPNSVVMMNDVSVDLPSGLQAKMICFALNQDGEYLWYENDITVSSSETLEIEFTTVDEATLLSNIESL